jgi:soluble lytic murein transglycosylase-like protein
VISPDPTTAPELVSETERPVRRSRKGRNLAFALVSVVAIAFASSACTPELIAKDAIEKYWAHNAACAERIAERESGLDPTAVNPYSGATGLFQLMPLHKTWIKNDLGYDFSQMKDAYKNSEAAKLLSYKNYVAYGDGWAPWRLSGRAIRGGGCPA